MGRPGRPRAATLAQYIDAMASEPGDFRLSDQQREQATQELREHFAAGRLSDEELSERVQEVYRAQTEAQLRALQADLPRLPPTPQQRRAELAARRAALQRRLLQESGGGAILFLTCTVIWVVSGANGQFWPIWVALLAVIPLLRNGWRLYGPDPQFDRVETDLARRARREQRRRDRL
ncbi:MAG: DUF1707 domain-containing protein [Solirubrobacteraceae bacterium]